MKKIMGIVACLSLCFSMICVATIQNVNALDTKEDVVERKGNLIHYIIKKRVTFTDNYVDCYFEFDADDITGEIFNLVLDDYVVGYTTGWTFDVDLYSAKKVDKYTYEATIRFITYNLDGKTVEYQKVYIEN